MSQLELLKQKLSKLSDAELDQLYKETGELYPDQLWFPQEGPQTAAYYSDADELLYGGSVGGGKSDLLIGYAVNKGLNSVIFRNGLDNVRDLENRAIAIRGTRDGFSSMYHYMDLGEGRSLEFDSLEQPGSEQSWQGRRRDVMGFDEAAQMAKSRVMFVLGWAGSAKPGARTRVFYATNPPLSDEGNWIIAWFAPWLDPLFPKPAEPCELRYFVNNKEGDPVWVKGPGKYDRGDGTISQAKSRTFIPSFLKDNAYLRDTDYRSRVENLPEPMRSAMLNGNFMAARQDHAAQVIPSEWVRLAQARWKREHNKRPMLSLGVDVAGGGPDKETIAALHLGNHFAEVEAHQGVDTKDGPATASRILRVQRNSAPIAIDMTGGWGGAAMTHLRQAEVDVTGFVFSTKTGAVEKRMKVPFGNLRSELYWEFREALDPQSGEDVELPPGARLTAELTAARWILRGSALWIESKEEIFKRIGGSTDYSDAIVLAWHHRRRGITKRVEKTKTQVDLGEADPFALEGF